MEEWFLTKTELESVTASGVCSFFKAKKWEKNIFFIKVQLNRPPNFPFFLCQLGFTRRNLAYELQNTLTGCTTTRSLLCLSVFVIRHYTVMLMIQMVTVSLLLSFGPVWEYTNLISCNKFYSDTQEKRGSNEISDKICSQGLLEDWEQTLTFWLLSTAFSLFQELICVLEICVQYNNEVAVISWAGRPVNHRLIWHHGQKTKDEILQLLYLEVSKPTSSHPVLWCGISYSNPLSIKHDTLQQATAAESSLYAVRRDINTGFYWTSLSVFTFIFSSHVFLTWSL